MVEYLWLLRSESVQGIFFLSLWTSWQGQLSAQAAHLPVSPSLESLLSASSPPVTGWLARFLFAFPNSQAHTSGTHNSILPVFVSFLSLWQNSWENQLKEQRLYFSSWFQRSQSMLIGSVVSGLVWSKAAHLVAAGKQRESQRREHGSHYLPQGRVPNDLTFLH